MSSEEHINIGPTASAHGTPPADVSGQAQQQPVYPQTSAQPVTQDTATYGAVYPEVYYKLRPYILMGCDIMDAYGATMPTQQQVEQMSDRIFEDACKMYPDLAGYLRKYDDAKDDPPQDPPFPRGRFRPGAGFGGFRRRGLGRDLIEALLLAELFGRRRYYY